MTETQATMTGPPTAPGERRYASHSSLSKHRECPQKWYYGHVRKLTKVDPEDAAVERDMGSWWHMLRAADSIERGRRFKSLQHMPEELTSTDDGPRLRTSWDDLADKVLDQAKLWWDKQSTSTQAAWLERIGEDLSGRLAALDTRWAAQWDSALQTERPLAVELRWERALPPLPSWDAVAVDPNVTLVGYVDEVYYDTKRSVVVCRDHKISKKLGQQTSADDMMDSQLQLYAWGANPIVTAWGRGSIKATAYDRVRMVRPPTPKVTISGTLSKSVSDYDLRTYLEWCDSKPPYAGRTKDGSQAGIYEQEEREIERLRSPAVISSWFQRTLTPLNPHLIRAHLRAAVDSAIDMGVSYERARLENAAARNLTWGNCRWCDFAGLCRSEMFGGAQGDFNLADFRLVQKGKGR